MRYQSSASSVKIKIQKMASKPTNPPALDPKVVVKLESGMCMVKYPRITTDYDVYTSVIQHKKHA